MKKNIKFKVTYNKYVLLNILFDNGYLPISLTVSEKIDLFIKQFICVCVKLFSFHLVIKLSNSFI